MGVLNRGGQSHNPSPVSFLSPVRLLTLHLLILHVAAEGQLLYYKNGKTSWFLASGLAQSYTPPVTQSISPPTGSAQVRVSSYSITTANYIKLQLPASSLSVGVQFDRNCILPILFVGIGNQPTVTFTSPSPQTFYITADQCGAPNIDTYTQRNMASVNPFGLNTFNPRQTDFFQQTITFPSNPNGYGYEIGMFCPWFQGGWASFNFQLTIDFGSSNVENVSVYDAGGKLLVSPVSLTVNAKSTVMFAVRPPVTAAALTVNSSVVVWMVVSTSSGRRLRLLQPALGTPSKATTSQRTEVSTASGSATLTFPSAYDSCDVYMQNTGNSPQTAKYTFTEATAGLSATAQLIIIIVCGSAGFVLLLTLTVVIIVKLSQKKAPQIVYQQRTFVIDGELVQQNVQILDAQTFADQSFKVREMNAKDWERIEQTEQRREAERQLASGAIKTQTPAQVAYQLDLKVRDRRPNEPNVLANYMERTI